jgi:tRNA pseudouridine13 synthase
MTDEANHECHVGIKEYANKAPGFQGIHKQRYSDFVVREITRSEGLAVLNQVNVKELEQIFNPPPELPKRKDDDGADIDLVNEFLSDVTKFLDDSGFEESINSWKTSKEATESFLRKCIDKEEDCPSHHVSFCCTDKALRTEAHTTLKKYLLEHVDSMSEDIEGKQHMKFAAKHKLKGKGNGQKRFSSQWPKGMGDFLKFTLIKENVDTMSASSIIAKTLNLKRGAASVSYAGTKDKRAVTVQSCTLFRRKPAELNRLNGFKRPPVLRVGNFEYVENAISMGDLAGNHFTIVLRAVDADTQRIKEAFEQLQHSGFINYYGLQRFGTGSAGSHMIGKALMKGEWKNAIDNLFKDFAGDKDDMKEAKRFFREKDYVAARALLPKYMDREKDVLSFLAKHPHDYLGAYNHISKQTRLLCMHAYQSYIWNLTASERIRLYGLQCVEGDLVPLSNDVLQLATDDEVSEPQPDGDSKGTKRDADGNALGRENMSESSVRGDDFQRSKKVQHENIHIVTAEDVASKKYTIADVILPIPGCDVVLPSHSLGKFFLDAMAEDGISLETFSTCQPMYRSRGAYRRLIQRPEDLEWSIVQYPDPNAEIVKTELDMFRSGELSGRDRLKEDSKGAGTAEDTETTSSAIISSVPGSVTIIDPSSVLASSHTRDPSGASKVDDAALRAAVVAFSLPPGTYATMLLRELTKAGTEKMYQAQLSASTGAATKGSMDVDGGEVGNVSEEK